MDFASLDTRDLSTKGIWIELLHPATGKVIADEDGVTAAVFVYGPDSEQYKASLKAAMQDESGRDKSALHIAGITAQVRGIPLDGKPLDAKDPARLYDFYARCAWAWKQVDKKVSDYAFLLQATMTA